MRVRARELRYHGAGKWLAAAGLLALLVVLAWIFASAPARAERRIALVIANAAYRTAPLPNPRADAALVAPALAASGFEVVRADDLTRVGIRAKLSAFAHRLTGPDTVALFYYTGHAVQVAGQNYVLPVDADVKSAADIRLQGVRLDEILAAMRPDQARLSIAILDACRDDPFPAATRSLARGLAPVAAPAGTLIAFSTAPGDVASDGDGAVSPYAAAFASALARPGLTIEDVFKRTRVTVMEATAGAQVPWEHSSLTGRFVFRPGEAASGGDRDPVSDSGRLISGPQPPLSASPAALYTDALRLETRHGGRADFAAARVKLEAAAQAGYAPADYRLFLYYEEGRGMPHDPGKAADRLLSAYRAGGREAERLLLRYSRRLRRATRRMIQHRLRDAGHFAGTPDGVFDRRTIAALDAYRR